jgi:signal transduction histidine kinase
MRDLINDLLESERLGQGHAALHLEPTRLAPWWTRCWPSWKAVPASTPDRPALPELALDRSRMRLLLRNLLDNALRHSPRRARRPA